MEMNEAKRGGAEIAEEDAEKENWSSMVSILILSAFLSAFLSEFNIEHRIKVVMAAVSFSSISMFNV
jgi:hypothetical protein